MPLAGALWRTYAIHLDQDLAKASPIAVGGAGSPLASLLVQMGPTQPAGARVVTSAWEEPPTLEASLALLALKTDSGSGIKVFGRPRCAR